MHPGAEPNRCDETASPLAEGCVPPPYADAVEHAAASIDDAAETWGLAMGKSSGGLDFVRGIYTGPASNWTDTSIHLFWEGNFPSTWGCSSSFDACTFIRPSLPSSHITDVDTVLLHDNTWPSDGSECVEFNDVGRFAGPRGGTDWRADQLTFALHEFGHWYRLNHSTVQEALMAVPIQHCFASPTGYDYGLGYANYEDHH